MFKNLRNFDLTTGVKSARLAVLVSPAGIDVLLHKTVIVSKRGRTVTLDNGGWDTVSTRTAMNTAVSQICASNCYIYRHKKQTLITQNGLVKPFTSGMTLKVLK